MTDFISHFHCPQCEQAIDICSKDELIDVFEPTVMLGTVIHTYKCKTCGKVTKVAVEMKDDKWKFSKFVKE